MGQQVRGFPRKPPPLLQGRNRVVASGATGLTSRLNEANGDWCHKVSGTS